MLPAAPGQIWKDRHFRIQDGSIVPHYLLILGTDKYTVTARVLTSQVHGRPEVVGCQLTVGFQEGHFVGILGGVLTSPTWVNLSRFDDIDMLDFEKRAKTLNRYEYVMRVAPDLLCEVLACAIGADGTTPTQEQLFWSARASIGC